MKRILLLRIGTDPVARICSGAAPIIIPADSVEDAPAKYLGGGTLVEIPELEQVINGTAQRISITVSGVSQEAVRLFADESDSLKGATVHIGIAYQDDDWQVTEVEWLAELRCDFPTATGSRSSRSISISIGSDDTDRSKAPGNYRTAAGQRRKSPTDQFYDHKAGITQGTSRRFGPSD
jgi:hypothetical protein